MEVCFLASVISVISVAKIVLSSSFLRDPSLFFVSFVDKECFFGF